MTDEVLRLGGRLSSLDHVRGSAPFTRLDLWTTSRYCVLVVPLGSRQTEEVTRTLLDAKLGGETGFLRATVYVPIWGGRSADWSHSDAPQAFEQIDRVWQRYDTWRDSSGRSTDWEEFVQEALGSVAAARTCLQTLSAKRGVHSYREGLVLCGDDPRQARARVLEAALALHARPNDQELCRRLAIALAGEDAYLRFASQQLPSGTRSTAMREALLDVTRGPLALSVVQNLAGMAGVIARDPELRFLNVSLKETARIVETNQTTRLKGPKDRVEADLGVCMVVAAFPTKGSEQPVFVHLHPWGPWRGVAERLPQAKAAWLRTRLAPIKGEFWRVAILAVDPKLYREAYLQESLQDEPETWRRVGAEWMEKHALLLPTEVKGQLVAQGVLEPQILLKDDLPSTMSIEFEGEGMLRPTHFAGASGLVELPPINLADPNFGQ